MSVVVVPNEGILDWAAVTFGPLAGPLTYLVDLYQNDVETGQLTTFADFDLCTFPGYATVTVSSTAISMPVLEGNAAVSSYLGNPISWPNNGNQPAFVWGYCVRNARTGHVLWCQTFDAVFVLGVNCVFNLDLVFSLYEFVLVP